MKSIKIENKLIGENKPCFIIAEAGVNHNGDLDLAKKLVDFAKEAGADAVKFQTFKAEDMVIKEAEMAEYQKKNIGKRQSQMQLLKNLELKYECFKELKEYCVQKKIIFISTPHTSDAADFLDSFVSVYKIASPDITNMPLLEKIGQKKKPIILSTGMADLEEIREAVGIISKQRNKEIIILHCTSNYPCPLDEVNLKAMKTLEKEFDCLVGYSDHTLGFKVPIMAVAMGASVLEKHFTLDKNMAGPDHKASLNPEELKEMIKSVRKTEKILGSGIKKPFESERIIGKLVRKSLVARKDIDKGSIIKENMLEIKRPGTGISSKEIKKVIKRKAKKRIKKGQLINWRDLSLPKS